MLKRNTDVRISWGEHNSIVVDEVYHLPMGVMFCLTDEDTSKPYISILTYAGVLIEYLNEHEISPELLHTMIKHQKLEAEANVELMKEAYKNREKKLEEPPVTEQIKVEKTKYGDMEVV